jgi:UDP-N-acetylmuramoyl-L-alanyl-D-glutamate--2,6-diaminopimelate ligase
MRLSALLGDRFPDGLADPEITGVTDDSRRVRPGMLFVAVPGTTQDGHAFAGDAIARGAAAVVAEQPLPSPDGVPVVRVASARAALAEAAATFHGHPAADLTIVGFTGTFGKTSTSGILRALLDTSGARAGVLGSLGARYGGFHAPGTGLTTPAPVELQAALGGLRDAGADTVIMEVTSHALRMQRVAGLRFQGGLLSAIVSGEHTDFHGTFDDYVAAKRLFLDYLHPEALLAFDADNEPARTLAADARVRRRSGFTLEDRAGAAVALRDIVLDHTGAHFTIDGERLHSALLGRGHLRNVALALAYALPAGVSLARAREVLTGLVPLRRRMESFEVAGRTVLDDTAAHPDSLEATFEVADLLSAGLRARQPDSRIVVVYAVRGSRGRDINRRNAAALAALTGSRPVHKLIVTLADDTAGPNDRVTLDEADATRDALSSLRPPPAWHETLSSAMTEALAGTRAGDLLVLAGAQGMDAGRARLGDP